MQIKQLGALIALPVAALAMTACSSTPTTVTATSPAANNTAPASQPATSAAASSGPASSAPASSPAATQTVTQTTSASSAPAQSAQKPGGSQSSQASQECGTKDMQTAFENNVGKLEPFQGHRWVLEQSAAKGYDGCAPLSWIVVGTEGGTGSSPTHIMLFHQGEFVGTATKDPQGFGPAVTPQGKPVNAINVTYKYLQGNDSNANPTGRANATFTWNEAQQKVVMTGDVPPKR